MVRWFSVRSCRPGHRKQTTQPSSCSTGRHGAALTLQLYIDGPTEQMAAAITEEMMRDARRYAYAQLLPHLDAAVLRHGGGGTRLTGEIAGNVLEATIQAVTRALYADTNGYSSLRWLWLLRRIPGWVFEGDYKTSHGYDSTLAEVIAGAARGRSRLQIQDDVRAYPLDATVFRRVARHCACTWFLSQLHRDYRWAGKGATFEFRRGCIPERLSDDALRSSVYLYDERAELGGGGRMGTEVFQPSRAAVDLRQVLRTLDADPLTMIFRLVPVRPPVEAPVPMIDADVTAGQVPMALVRARYMLIPVPLENLATLVAAAPPARPIFDRRAAALLFMIFASTAHVVDHRAGFKSIFQTGYLLFSEAAFRVRLADAFTVTPQPIKQILDAAGIVSDAEIFDLLTTMSGAPWPLQPGPVLYRDGDALAVDLVSASRRLSDAVVYPQETGPIANTRSGHFELRVQAAVDGSRYAAPENLRALRGRKLRLRGRDVTDIDAIAKLSDDTLLLISCKSIIYTLEYDAGQYRAVRNAASTVRDAVLDWAENVATLRTNPIGENYDLSGWNLLGVVCTPSVIWIELGPCTEFVVPKLRAAVSLAELQAWLAGEA